MRLFSMTVPTVAFSVTSKAASAIVYAADCRVSSARERAFGAGTDHKNRWSILLRQLEVVFERELHLAHAGAGPSDLSEARNSRLVRASPACVRGSELDVVRR